MIVVIALVIGIMLPFLLVAWVENKRKPQVRVIHFQPRMAGKRSQWLGDTLVPRLVPDWVFSVREELLDPPRLGDELITNGDFSDWAVTRTPWGSEADSK